MADMAAIYTQALAHARRCAVADPAIEPCDLIQSAYLKCAAVLPNLPSDLDRLRLLLRCVSQVAIDLHRQAARRPRATYGDWLPSGQRVDDEAIAGLELAATLAQPRRGAGLAVLSACGWTRDEIAAATGIPANTVGTTIWRWQTAARAEVLA